MSYKRKKVIQALNHFSFTFIREGANHTAFGRESKQVYLPRHNELDRGLVRAVVKQADLDWQEFKKRL